MPAFRSHALRKFFASQVYNNGLSETDARFLLGHAIDKTSNAYIKRDLNNLEAQYLKIMPALSMESVNTLTLESEEYNSLKNENENLRNELADIKSKLPDLEELRDLIANPKIKKLIDDETK